jgi:hypothetical protein
VNIATRRPERVERKPIISERSTQISPHPEKSIERGPLNLDVAKIAKEIALQKEEPSLNAPELAAEAKLGRAIAAAARPDCRSAYSGAGILAIPLLLVDFVTDTGCSW